MIYLMWAFLVGLLLVVLTVFERQECGGWLGAFVQAFRDVVLCVSLVFVFSVFGPLLVPWPF